ncbi:MAG TPA: DUF134 domain-containing protein [Caldithrix abyssi]|uniref:UPF0251 protein ENK44_02570 n=1 Tax=Caldithrix abyssi TaxID=187145 RepID=A0A7V4U0E4_CALAY|nr:DUF134 domain-containing protein [Caldithrix abyssi]
MRGPYRKRRVQRPPQFSNFKPSGIPRKYLDSIELTVDEFEAIRLADYLQKEHAEAAEMMQISRPTFTRLIQQARRKLATAIIEGMELVIIGGNIDFEHTLHRCHDCGEVIQLPVDVSEEDCPGCGSQNVEDLARSFIMGRHHRGGRR